ncbi:MAG: hypothetical protein GY906_37150 [bacterium]|nr:hypothetical protein [bacterium]
MPFPGFPRAVTFPAKPFVSLNGVTAAGSIGAVAALSDYRKPAVQVIGIGGGGTVLIKVANDPKNPVWADVGAPITADGMYEIDEAAILGRTEIGIISTTPITTIFSGGQTG